MIPSQQYKKIQVQFYSLFINQTVSISFKMDPTLLYNGYHLERRKVFQNNPRSNLISSFQLNWTQSIENKLTPTQKIKLERIKQARQIGKRSNELISRRLKKQVGIIQEYDNKNYKTLDIGNVNLHNRSKSLHMKQVNSQKQQNSDLRDSLNVEIDNFYGKHQFLNNSPKYSKMSNRNGSDLNQQHRNSLDSSSKRQNLILKNNYSIGNDNDNYLRRFDPQIQSSAASRRSFAESQLSSLASKDNYMGRLLNKRLSKYLEPKNSRQSNFYDLQRELVERK